MSFRREIPALQMDAPSIHLVSAWPVSRETIADNW